MPEDTFPQAPTRADILRWLTGNSDLNTDSIVTMTDDVVVAVTAREDRRGVDRSTRLTLREEVINPDAAAAWGGRSIQLDLDLDCSRHRVILGTRRVYARPNLQGSARITRSDNAWAEVPSDTVIDDVARAVCSAKAPAQLAEAQPTSAAAPAVSDSSAVSAQAATEPPPEVAKAVAKAAVKVAAADPAPAPAVAPPAAQAPAAKAPADQSAVAKAAPAAAPQASEAAPAAVQLAEAAPAIGKVVAFDPPVDPAAPAAAAATIAAPSATSVTVVPPEPASPVVVRNPFRVAEADKPAAAPAPQNPAPRPAARAARPVPPTGSAPRPPEVAVQIAAAASADLARDSWQSLKAKLPSLVGQQTFAVEPVEAKGRTLYRALLLGFASPVEAADLCRELRSQSVDCILRSLR